MEDRIGIDFSSSGSVMTKKQLEEQRRKRGQCLTCGQKCFQKTLFKLIPLTTHGKVLDGRCLICKPLDITSNDTVLPAVSRPATRQDMERFTRSQSSLRLQGAGVNPPGSRRQLSPSRGAASSTMSRGVSNASLGTATASLGDFRNSSTPSSGSIARISEEGARAHSTRSARSADDDLESQNHRSPGVKAIRSNSMTPDILRGREGGESSARTRSSANSRGHSPTLPSSRTSASQSLQPSTDLASRSIPLESTHEEEEDDTYGNSIHAAMLGGMAARKMVQNFRSRKAAQAASTIPSERAPDRFDDTLSPESISRERWSKTESINSRDSRSWKTDEWKADDDDALQYLEPVHGILNRGGAFKFTDDEVMPISTPAPFPTMIGESSRTMSSMSSVEDDGGGGAGRQLSWKPAAEFSMRRRAADLVEDDIDDLSVDSEPDDSRERLDANFESRSNLSSRSGRISSSHSRYATKEQRAIESMSACSQSYRDIVKIMRDFGHSSLVQQEGLKHISNLHLTDAEYSELVEIGTSNVVIAAMTTHFKSSEVQSGACRAIWNLSASSENQIQLVRDGALDCILAAMDAYPADAELQEKALAALSNLGAAMENQSIILEKGAIQRIVEAMNRHSEDGPVQSKACSALTNLASYDSPLKRQIMQLGGGGAVVISMIMHPEDIELQEKALRALRNICANSDENKVEVANVGGIDAVISAMQVHRDEPGVQEAGAWTLSNLAVNPENKAVIGDSGGIDVVIRAMWVHSDNVGVQEWCCRALWTLSVDAQNRQVMMEVGGISAVVNAMQAHADAATVQEKGCGVLSNLAATDDACKIRIVDEEALDAIIMAMVLHSENRSVQDRACSVLKRLAIGPNLKAMQVANVDELVRQAARKFPEKCQDKAKAILSVL